VQDLQRPSGRGDIELVVECPDVIGSLGVEPICGCCDTPTRRRLCRFGGATEASSRHNRWIRLRLQTCPSRTSTAWARRYPTADVPVRRLGADRADHDPDPTRRTVTLRRSVLTNDLARPPLRDAEPHLQHVRGSATPRRAHQFPRAISLSARTSSSLSATSCLSRVFSTSSSFSRFTSSAFIPPY
jgi:hypothetical protein